MEATLRDANKFQVFAPAAGQDKVKVYKPLRTRVETFLFPATDRATWDQIKDGAASRGHMVWTEPDSLDRMREALITAGEWREEAGQILKPPFDEVTGVTIEYSRSKETGGITTTDIKISNADKLFVREDNGAWLAKSPDTPIVSDAMLIEFKAVDSLGKNKEGKPYRIDNWIDVYHNFMDSPTAGNKVVKVKIVPPSCTLLYTTDGSSPVNSGKPYIEPGIDAPQGAFFQIHASKGSVTKDLSFTIPKQVTGDSEGPSSIKTDLPVTVSGLAIKHLVTRSASYQFLNSLPEETNLQMVQAKVTHAATDNTVTLNWNHKTLLKPVKILEAFEFLDKQVSDGEWGLGFKFLHFLTGKVFIQWQVETNTKIESSQVTQ